VQACRACSLLKIFSLDCIKISLNTTLLEDSYKPLTLQILHLLTCKPKGVAKLCRGQVLASDLFWQPHTWKYCPLLLLLPMSCLRKGSQEKYLSRGRNTKFKTPNISDWFMFRLRKPQNLRVNVRTRPPAHPSRSHAQSSRQVGFAECLEGK